MRPAKLPKGQRRDKDQYFSPAWAVDKLLEHVCFKTFATILEPCNGTGMLSDPLKAKGFEVVTNDLDVNLPADFNVDYLKQSGGWMRDHQRPDWIVTNPPFKIAFPILKKAMEEATWGVAFLLRLSFIEPTFDRGNWLEACPPTVQIVLPRYSFTGDGGKDLVTCAWFVWRKFPLNSPQKIAVCSKGSRPETKRKSR